MLPSLRGILSVTKEKDWLESGAPRLEIKQIGGVIPNLLIGGIDKGGTTEAWHMSNQLFLTQTRKEPGCLYQIPLGLAAVKLCYKNLWDSLQPMPNSSKRVLHLDATPSYLYSLVNFNLEPSPPRVLFQISPQCAVVFLLREPVKRIRSLYNHWCYRPPHPTNIECIGNATLQKAVDEELSLLKALTQELLDFVNASCIYRTDCDLWSAGWRLRMKLARSTVSRFPYVMTSMYFPFIYTWTLYFGGRLAVMQSEYFFQDTTRLWGILGIRSDFHLLETSNPARGYGSKSQLSPTTTEELQEFFRKPNALLRTYLQSTSEIAVQPPVLSTNWWAK